MKHLVAIILAAGLSAGALVGCGGSEYVITGTNRAPGMDGTVQIEEHEGNYMITVEVHHLPPADRLQSGMTTYCVWIKGKSGEAQMVGVLNYDPDDRTGRMRATTPLARAKVIVTAEKNAAVRQPSEFVVAQQEVQ